MIYLASVKSLMYAYEYKHYFYGCDNNIYYIDEYNDVYYGILDDVLNNKIKYYVMLETIKVSDIFPLPKKLFYITNLKHLSTIIDKIIFDNI